MFGSGVSPNPDKAVQSSRPDARPGQACTEPGAYVDLAVASKTSIDPSVNILEVGRRWLEPFLLVRRITRTAYGFVASGNVIDQTRLEKNVDVGLVKLKGATFSVKLMTVQDSAAWHELDRSSDDDDQMDQASSWSSEFDSTDDEAKQVKPKRPRTPTQKKQRNKRRKQARARKRSLSGSGNDLTSPPAMSVAPHSVPATTVPPAAMEALPSVRATTTDNSAEFILTPAVSTLLPATFVSVPSTPVPVHVSSVDNGVSAEAPATFNAARPKRAKKQHFTALDLSKVNVPVPVTQLETFLFRPVDPSASLQKSNPRDLFAQLGTFGKFVARRDIRAGGLAVDYEATTADHKALLALNDVQGYKVTVSRPLDAHANACGVLTGIHPDLTDDDLKSAIVSDVEAISFKRLAKPDKPSWVVKVTFAGPAAPKDVRLYGRKHVVKPYESRPLQCLNCSRFGHPARTCRSATRCATCSEPHKTSDCPATSTKCANCGGNHAANDPNCPNRAFQTKVLETKQQHGLTFRAARSAVNKATRTYAAALQGPPPPPRQPGPQTTSTPVPRPPAQPASTQTDPTPAATQVPPGQHQFEDLLIIISQAIIKVLAQARADPELIKSVSSIFTANRLSTKSSVRETSRLT